MEKIFESFANIYESRRNNVVNDILDELKDVIDKMMDFLSKSHFAKFETEMTEFDYEMSRLNLIFDLLNAIEKYTKADDKLISVKSHTSIKGNIEISAEIERDGKIYNFRTEAIYAGGYNIQRLHYRYITKTDLPQTGNNILTKEYKEKIKKLSKVEKLEKSIREFKKRIERTEEEVNDNKKLTDEEILSKNDYWQRSKDLDWNEIVKRGADKNYDYDPKKFYDSQEKYRQSIIDSFKSINIKNEILHIELWKKEIKKLEDKLKKEMDKI